MKQGAAFHAFSAWCVEIRRRSNSGEIGVFVVIQRSLFVRCSFNVSVIAVHIVVVVGVRAHVNREHHAPRKCRRRIPTVYPCSWSVAGTESLFSFFPRFMFPSPIAHNGTYNNRCLTSITLCVSHAAATRGLHYYDSMASTDKR